MCTIQLRKPLMVGGRAQSNVTRAATGRIISVVGMGAVKQWIQTIRATNHLEISLLVATHKLDELKPKLEQLGTVKLGSATESHSDARGSSSRGSMPEVETYPGWSAMLLLTEPLDIQDKDAAKECLETFLEDNMRDVHKVVPDSLRDVYVRFKASAVPRREELVKLLEPWGQVTVLSDDQHSSRCQQDDELKRSKNAQSAGLASSSKLLAFAEEALANKDGTLSKRKVQQASYQMALALTQVALHETSASKDLKKHKKSLEDGE